jgi:predicted PurR-regulated permease PerM
VIKVDEKIEQLDNLFNNFTQIFSKNTNTTHLRLNIVAKHMATFIANLKDIFQSILDSNEQEIKIIIELFENLQKNVTTFHASSKNLTEARFANFSASHADFIRDELSKLSKEQKKFLTNTTMTHTSNWQNFTAQKFANFTNAQQSFVEKKLEKLSNEQKNILVHTTNNHSAFLQNFTEHQHRHSMKAHEMALQNVTSKIERKLQKQHKRVVNWATAFVLSIIGSFVVILGCICTCFSCIYYKLNRTHNTAKNVWHTVGPNCPACQKGKKIRVYSPSKRRFSVVEEEIELMNLKPNEVLSKNEGPDREQRRHSIEDPSPLIDHAEVHRASARGNEERDPSPPIAGAAALEENQEPERSLSGPAVLVVDQNLSSPSGTQSKEGVTANVSNLRAIYEAGKK